MARMFNTWIAFALVAVLAASAAEAKPGNGHVFDSDSPACRHAAAPARDSGPLSSCDAETPDEVADDVADEPVDVASDESDVAIAEPDYFMILGDAERYTPPCRVPRLIGMKRAPARRALKRAHCRVGNTRGRRAHGRVRRLSARAGSVHRAGFRVRLTFR